MVVTKKVQLIVQGDKAEVNRVYQYIRNGCYTQNKAYNYLLSCIYASYVKNDEDEVRRDLYKRGSRQKGSLKEGGSLYDTFEEFDFPTGLRTAAWVGNTVKQDMNTQIKAGLFRGKTSLRNRKLDAPLAVPSKALFELYSPYADEEEIYAHAYKSDFEVYMKFVNNITFRLRFGSMPRSRELRTSIARVLTGEYAPCSSSLSIKKGKIFMNLCIDIGEADEKKLARDENMVIGCHVGFNTPIVCACTGGKFPEHIGSTEGFIANRLEYQYKRSRAQAAMRYTRGGHGRKKKLGQLNKIKQHEKNFAKTFNHQLSAAVIKYAVSKNAKYINIGAIDSKKLDEYVLRNWTYYQLLNFIEYKAKIQGIKVRYVKMTDEVTSDEEAAKKLVDATSFVTRTKLEKIEEKEAEKAEKEIKEEE